MLSFCCQIDLERRAERLRKREEKVARREADVELRQQTAARLAEKVGPHWTLRRCRIQRSWALRL